MKFRNDFPPVKEQCETRPISDYADYCDTHKQDASLCHLIPEKCPRCGQKEYIRLIGVCNFCEKADKWKA